VLYDSLLATVLNALRQSEEKHRFCLTPLPLYLWCSTPYGISGKQEKHCHSSHLKVLNAFRRSEVQLQSNAVGSISPPTAKVEFPHEREGALSQQSQGYGSCGGYGHYRYRAVKPAIQSGY
jgi:hypothetical protein